MERLRVALHEGPGVFLPDGDNDFRPPIAETRVVDPKTGAAKGQKLERTDLLPPDALLEVARIYGLGAAKYADRNWEGGYAWGLSIGALKRHLFQWEAGATFDEEDHRHLAAVAWHALALLAFELRNIGTDDRPDCSHR